MSLASELLVIGKVSRNLEVARTRIKKVIEDGRALEKFAEMIDMLGGNAKIIDKPEDILRPASLIRDVYPRRSGVVSFVDTRALGVGIVEMGGGRAKVTDSIDYSVGLSNIAQIGEKVGQGGRPLATIHAKNQYSFQHMEKIVQDAYETVDRRIIDEPVIRETLTELEYKK